VSQIVDVDAVVESPDPRAMLLADLADLADFVTRHRACVQLTGDATEPEANGYMVTVACSCGGVFMRWVTPEEAADELVMSDFATWMSRDQYPSALAPSP
jgi:hypothetical protein